MTNKPYQPYVDTRDGQRYYVLPVESGFASLSFEFPITQRDVDVLERVPKRYYNLFAALYAPFQLPKDNLSNAEVRHYMDIILHADDTDVEAFIDRLEQDPHRQIRYLSSRFKSQ